MKVKIISNVDRRYAESQLEAFMNKPEVDVINVQCTTNADPDLEHVLYNIFVFYTKTRHDMQGKKSFYNN